MPCLRLGHGDTEALGEAPERVARAGVVDAATRDQERPPRLLPPTRGLGDERGIGTVASLHVHSRLEEALGKISGFRLHVLRQREGDRSAVGRVGEHGNRLGQRSQELLGARDAVPVARYRPEAVVRADRAVGEVLDLLQHRVGAAAREYIARQQQHGQPVDVRQCGRRHHVGRARADRSRARHHAPPTMRLRIGDRGVRHRLLVVGAQGRKAIAYLRQRLAHPGDVAVTEDREHSVQQRHGAAIDDRLLRHQEAHQRLRGRESQALHASALRAACQCPIRRW